MRKVFGALIIIAILLGMQAGCQQKEEWELSVFELKFSNEQKEELLSSYSAWKEAEWGLKVNSETWAEYSDTEESGLSFSGYRYYGTFDDCVVWFRGGEPRGMSTAAQMYVGDSYFSHPYSAQYWVRNSENFYSLTEAYEQGFISAEEVAIVAERHAEYNNAVSIKSNEWARIAVKNGALDLSEEKQKQIKLAFMDYCESRDSRINYAADQMVVHAVWCSDGIYALYMDIADHMYIDEEEEIQLPKHGELEATNVNYTFTFPNSQRLFLYKDDTIYTLEEAWDAGVLTNEHAESLLKDNAYLRPYPYVFYSYYE